MAETAAIILAAGKASRFAGAGQGSKVLALYEGKPLVWHAATIAAVAGLGIRIVVAGDYFDQISELFGADETIRVKHNANFRDGLASSIRCGFEALPTSSESVFIMLADMPLVRPETLRAMEGHLGATGCDAVVPTYRDQGGNPCLIGRTLFPKMLRLTGDQGARFLLRTDARTEYLSVDDPGILVDIDTVEELTRLTSGRSAVLSRSGHL